MSDPVNPNHYHLHGIQAIDILIEQLSTDNLIGYYKGNVFKYIFRVGMKGEKEHWAVDIKKAQWYLDQLKLEIEKL